METYGGGGEAPRSLNLSTRMSVQIQAPTALNLALDAVLSTDMVGRTFLPVDPQTPGPLLGPLISKGRTKEPCPQPERP
jgi:hypothetical protein